MVIVGSWMTCDDGETRPVIRIGAAAARSQVMRADFLVDSGADRTVFDPGFLAELQLPSQPPPSGMTFEGVGGASPFVVVTTVLELTGADGAIARVKGQFGAFTDPAAIDLCILGRDVLQHFDVIVSRRRNQVLLLAANHEYLVKTS